MMGRQHKIYFIMWSMIDVGKMERTSLNILQCKVNSNNFECNVATGTSRPAYG